MPTKIETLFVKELITGINEDSQNSTIDIALPKFQRNLVWSDAQKKDFIDSIKKEFPFGTLLLYKQSDQEKPHLLLDGLQRTNTVLEYVEEPNKFFSMQDIPPDLPKQLLNIIPTLEVNQENLEKIKDAIVRWFRAHKGFDEDKDQYSSFDLAQYLIASFSLPENIHLELTNKMRKFVSDVKRDSDINNAQIPVIIYSGDEADLSTIFHRINSRGTFLNKYQIFAALWREVYVEIENPEIIEMIKLKYQNLLDQGFVIKDFDPLNMASAKYNLFEYLFGFDKLINKKFENLFGQFNESQLKKSESIAFNIFTICCGLLIKDMVKLPGRVVSYNLLALEEAILDSTKFVNETLSPILNVRANRQVDSKYSIYHTENQIISFITFVFHSKYDKDLNIKDSWNSSKVKLKSTIPMYYLYDIIRSNWSGTGDSRLNNIILNEGHELFRRYDYKITKSNWEFTLSEWFAEQLAKKEKDRVSINKEVILFLKFLYSHIFTVNQNYNNVYELEHIFPLARLKEAAKAHNGLPISHIGNLALLEKEVNRDKREDTIREYLYKQLENNSLTEKQVKIEKERFNKELFINVDEITIPKKNGKEIITREWYEKFLSNRFES